ncbi:MAG: zeta toxin family protein, partial [Elusimicrobia bacterium]|nr:zeta toxin family protein [Elusimicrobiota bacterium]
MSVLDLIKGVFSELKGKKAPFTSQQFLQEIKRTNPQLQNVDDVRLATALAKKEPERLSFLSSYKPETPIPVELTPMSMRDDEFYQSNPELSTKDALRVIEGVKAQYPEYWKAPAAKLAAALEKRYPDKPAFRGLAARLAPPESLASNPTPTPAPEPPTSAGGRPFPGVKDVPMNFEPLQQSSMSFRQLEGPKQLEQPSQMEALDQAAATETLEYMRRVPTAIENKIVETVLKMPESAVTSPIPGVPGQMTKDAIIAGTMELGGFYKGLTGQELEIKPETLAAIRERKISPEMAHAAGEIAGGLALLSGVSGVLRTGRAAEAVGNVFYRHPAIARYLAPTVAGAATFGGAGAVKQGIAQVLAGDLDLERFGKVVLAETAMGGAMGVPMGIPSGLARVAGASAVGFGTSVAQGGNLLDATVNGSLMGIFAAASAGDISKAQKLGAFKAARQNVRAAMEEFARSKGYPDARVTDLASLAEAEFVTRVEKAGGFEKLNVKQFDKFSGGLRQKLQEFLNSGKGPAQEPGAKPSGALVPAATGEPAPAAPGATPPTNPQRSKEYAEWEAMVPEEDRRTLAAQREKIKNIVPTIIRYADQAEGYIPERQSVHRQIIEAPEFNKPEAIAAPGEKPTAYLFIGPPGAGKSSAIEHVIPKEQRDRAVLLDNDEIKKMLPEWDPSAASAFHAESTDIAQEIRARLIEKKASFIEPQLGRDMAALGEKIALLNNSGYDVEMYLLDLPIGKAADRALARFKDSGRFVDPQFIFEKVGLNPVASYDKFKGEVVKYARYDPDVPKGTRPGFIEGADRRVRRGGRDRASALESPEGTLNQTGPDQPRSEEVTPTEGEPEGFASPMRGASAGRIPVAPVPGKKPKKLNEIIFDVSKALGRKVFIGKPSRASVGTYYPGSSATVVRYSGDLDTTAHELAHSLDDQLGIVAEWNRAGTVSPFDDELSQFWVYGSATNSGPRSSLTYKRAEGVAEFLRAYIVNPEATAKQAPKFHEYLQEKLPETTKVALKGFSDDVRAFAGAPAHEKIMANVDWTPPDSGWLRWLSGGKTGPGFSLTWADRLRTTWLNDLQAFDKAVEYARGERGIEKQLPVDNPQILSRLILGEHAKMDDIFEKGMIDADNKRVTKGGIEYLLEPLDTSSKAKLEQEMMETVSYMIAERTLEKISQRTEKALKIINQRRSALAERLQTSAEAAGRVVERIRDEAVQKEEAEYKEALEQMKDEARARIMDIDRRFRQEVEELRSPTLIATGPAQPGQVTRMRLERDTITNRVMEAHKARVARTRREHEARLAGIRSRFERQTAEVENRADAKLQGIEGRYLALATRFIEANKAAKISGAGGGIVTDYEVAIVRTLEVQRNPEKFARIRDAAQRYREWADAVLQYLRDKGRISTEQYEAIKENNAYYVAMQRVMEVSPDEEIVLFTGKGGGRLGSVIQPIQSFKGSTRAVQNPYTSLMESTYRSVREADRNDVMRAFRDLLTETRGMSQGEVPDLASVGRRAQQGDKNTISTFVNGEREVWQFQEDVYKALKGIVESRVIIPGWLTLIPRVFRATIVNFPPFLARNVIRDFWQRLVISDVNSTPIDQFRRRGPMDISDLKLHGGDQSGHFLRDRVDYMRAMETAMREVVKDKNAILVIPSKMARFYSAVAEASERTGRLAEYRAAFRHAKEKLGYDDYNAHLFAASKARGLMDFAVAGTVMRYVNQLIPFSNAAVQGLARTARAAGDNPGPFMAKWMLYVVLPTIAIYLLNQRDDKNEYAQQPAYLRDLFFNVKMGPNLWLRIPKSFEIGVLATGVERALDLAMGNKKAFDGYTGSVARSLLPIDEAALTGPFRGIVQVLANYDFFRQKNIIPPDEAKLDLDLRSTDRGSRLGQALQKVIGVDARNIDFLAREMFGYFGEIAVNLSDTGRPEKRGVGLHTTGLVANSPAYNARDVQWVM